jgi:hypothetical protein
MKALSTFGKLVVLSLLAVRSAQATPILDVTDVVDATDPTQMGRLSRNGIPQDWAGSEPFPGVINPTIQYHYNTYSVNVGNTPFVQIEMDSVSPNTFVSAYDTAYLPNSAGGANLGFDTNWLGDAGFTGDFFGVDTVFFQVIVPANHNLLLVVNTTGGGVVGAGDPFRLLAEGFIDNAFTDPEPAPEPATIFLLGGGLAVIARARRRRRA